MYLYDMETHQYETFQEQVNLVTVDGDPIDLSGKTARGQVRPAPNSNKITATMGCSVTEAKGIILFSLSSSQTAQIAPGKYFYDICIEEGSNPTVRQYIIGGKFTVYPSVTR